MKVENILEDREKQLETIGISYSSSAGRYVYSADKLSRRTVFTKRLLERCSSSFWELLINDIKNKTNSKATQEILNRMMHYYRVSRLSELALKIGVLQKVIFAWKYHGNIIELDKKCRQLFIYDEIFLSKTRSAKK